MPTFDHPSPSDKLLAELAARYTQITGDPIHRQKKVNLLATCYRRHGDDTLRFIADEFRRTGTAANLLGTVRIAPRRVAAQGGQCLQSAGGRGTTTTVPSWSADEVRALLGESEDEAHQRVADGEGEGLVWRVSAMQSQIPAHGPIPLLRARPELQLDSQGRCWSCSEPFDGDGLRCDSCIEAAHHVLHAIPRESTRPQPALDGRCPGCQRTADEKVATVHVAGFCDVCGWALTAKAS